MDKSNPFINTGAEWIWYERHNEVNRYIRFRHEFVFEGETGEDAVLHISTDTEYAV